jgi:carboxypeptidase Taq
LRRACNVRGNLYSAQLFARAQVDLGGLDGSFAQGDFSGLLIWLGETIDRQRQRDRPAALIERVTGSQPDRRPLVESLRSESGELCGI